MENIPIVLVLVDEGAGEEVVAALKFDKLVAVPGPLFRVLTGSGTFRLEGSLRKGPMKLKLL